MNSLFLCMITLIILFFLAYGIKNWFQYKSNQGKEQNNITIRKAIQSLLFGFLALVGLTPWTTSLIVQLINQVPGINLQENSSNEFIGGIAYLCFCISLTLVVYLYYANRHRLYHSQKETPAKGKINTTTMIYHKNKIKNSKLKTGRDLTIGDK